MDSGRMSFLFKTVSVDRKQLLAHNMHLRLVFRDDVHVSSLLLERFVRPLINSLHLGRLVLPLEMPERAYDHCRVHGGLPSFPGLPFHHTRPICSSVMFREYRLRPNIGHIPWQIRHCIDECSCLLSARLCWHHSMKRFQSQNRRLMDACQYAGTFPYCHVLFFCCRIHGQSHDPYESDIVFLRAYARRLLGTEVHSVSFRTYGLQQLRISTLGTL